jgi:2-oxoisovalerate dehydrogenase E1 component
MRDIPGLAIACPARGDDAVRMFRAAVAMAVEHGRVVLFLEPIALYHERDLHAEGDGGWLTGYPPPPEASLPGRVGIYQPDAEADPPDVLLVSYANGLRLSLQAQRILAAAHGVRARVLDLRWLNPLPLEAVRRHAAAAGRVLVVDECRATGGGVADAIVADLAERAFGGRLGSVRAADSFVPLGPAASTVLVSRDEIVDASLRLLDRDRAPAQPPSRSARHAVR